MCHKRGEIYLHWAELCGPYRRVWRRRAERADYFHEGNIRDLRAER